MIKDDFLIKTPSGLYCSYGDFYIDAELPVNNVVISHAHGDHARPGNYNVFCTDFTKQMMMLRFKKQAAHHFYTKSFDEKFEINGVEITFYPAGHILGSAMIKMTYDNTSYLYTGDYKLQEDATCEPIKFVNADVLITETTFANPNTIHPNPVEEIKKLSNIESNILLGVYGLGKAQRITELINRICPEKQISVHYSIFPIHELYLKNGINLGKYKIYDRKVLKVNTINQVYLIPPLTFQSYRGAKNVARIFASGWKNLQNGNDESLFISDHVDWNDIIVTIENVQPKEIWTLHGDGQMLKKHFEDKLKVKLL